MKTKITVVTLFFLVMAVSSAIAVDDEDLYKDAVRFLENNQDDFALMNFRTIARDFPESKYADEAQFRVAEIFYKQQAFREAFNEFEKHRRMFPHSIFSHRREMYFQKYQAVVLVGKGDALFKQKKWEQAIDVYNEAIILDANVVPHIKEKLVTCEENLLPSAKKAADEAEEPEEAEPLARHVYYDPTLRDYVDRSEQEREKPTLQQSLKKLFKLEEEDRIIVPFNVGYITGQTAYNFDNHTSELEYPMDDILVGSGITVDIDKYDLSIGTRFWYSVDPRNEYDMKDKDWDKAGTLISYTTSDTDMTAIIWDTNIRYDFLKHRDRIARNEARLGALAGYRYEHFDFDMYDLYYNVDQINDNQGQTTNIGEKVLTYEISYRMPYIGLAGDFEYKGVGIGFDAKYSFYPTARDKDEHLLRNLAFFAEYDKTHEVWFGSAYAYWRFLQNWTFKVGCDYTYMRIDGETWEASGIGAWETDQDTDARHFLGWGGFEYEF